MSFRIRQYFRPYQKMKSENNQHIIKMIIKTEIAGFRLLLLFGLFVFFTESLSGQGRNQEVTIIAPYQPTISDAVKMSIKPEIKDTVVIAPEMKYTISSQLIPTTYEIQPLKPIYLQIDPEQTLRRNYLKAGFGNYAMPYAEFFSNSLNSDKFSLGFHVRHLSSKGDIEDYPISAFSNNRASIYGKRYLSDKVFSADVYYNRDVVHYYGIRPDVDTAIFALPDDDLRQRLSLIGADVTLASNTKGRGKTNYLAGFTFYNLSDLFETSETHFGLKANYSSANKVLNVAGEEELGVDFDLKIFANNDSLQSQANLLTGLKPYLRLNFDYLDLTIGIEGAVAADSTSSFYVYPAIKAFFKVIPDYLRVYLAATGGLTRNSFYSTTRENPWINPIFPLGFTNTKYDFKGGVTGKFNPLLDFNFSVSYADVENMLFFINDYYTSYNSNVPYNFANKFTGIYDDAQVTTISAEIGYEQSEKLNALMTFNYREYSLGTQEHPWHKPAAEASLMGRYYLSPKLTASAELFYIGKTYAPILYSGLEPQTEKIDAYFDLNLGAEYRFNDKVAAFVQLNNMTASRYYRWQNYPSQRINVMGGLTFAF
ncbi:MAG: hypothetical protein IH598_03295 [Bacteroidales bacterium]|nr:hypothetical protein [Bacteroidales bacterium]